MKQPITIPFLPSTDTDMDYFTQKLTHGVKHSINNDPWNYKFSGEADFNIAYTKPAS